MSSNIRRRSRTNDPFPRSIARFAALPACAAALARVVCRACHGGGAMIRRRCQRRRAAGAYDGIWNVVFATTRGNCSSGYSVPFTVTGSRVSSAGGGRVSGSVSRAGGGCGQCFGRRIPGERRRPARRHQRRGILERHHFRRPLQRHLAGDAELYDRVGSTANENGPPDRLTGRLQFPVPSFEISAAPAPSRPGGLRTSRPARPWRTRRRRP